MALRQYPENDSLEAIWDDLVYSYNRLQADSDTRDLAEQVRTLINTSEDLWKQQRSVWRAETEAQSAVDAINYRADQRTEDLFADLTQANRKHPQGQHRQERYFPQPKSKIIELGLASQMKYIEDYANSLPKESEPELQAHGQGFLQDVQEGRAVLASLATAVANRRDFRVKELASFRVQANQTRTELYGELLKRSTSKNKSKDWADSFFRKKKQNTPEERRLERLRDNLFTSCELYGLTLSQENKKRILQEENAESLLQWLRKAASATSEGEVFS